MGVIEQLPQMIVDGNDIDCISDATETPWPSCTPSRGPRAGEGVSKLSAFR